MAAPADTAMACTRAVLVLIGSTPPQTRCAKYWISVVVKVATSIIGPVDSVQPLGRYRPAFVYDGAWQ